MKTTRKRGKRTDDNGGKVLTVDTCVEESETVANHGGEDEVEAGFGELEVKKVGRDGDEKTDENRHGNHLIGLSGREHLFRDCARDEGRV
jgi:hypothetical protein